MRIKLAAFFAAVSLFLFAGMACAASFDSVLAKWTRTGAFADGMNRLEVKVVFYSPEYIEALVQSEADKHLWTADEMENYKYQLFKTANIEETIPFYIQFATYGSPLHMAPFDKQVNLWIGGKKYAPVEVDPRFNFKVEDKIDGMIYFPRYDEKTHKDLLQSGGTMKLELEEGISPTLAGKNASFLWDLKGINTTFIAQGKAAAKLELDRLIKRLALLNDQKQNLEKQLTDVNAEIDKINARVEQLRKEE